MYYRTYHIVPRGKVFIVTLFRSLNLSIKLTPTTLLTFINYSLRRKDMFLFFRERIYPFWSEFVCVGRYISPFSFSWLCQQRIYLFTFCGNIWVVKQTEKTYSTNSKFQESSIILLMELMALFSKDHKNNISKVGNDVLK